MTADDQVRLARIALAHLIEPGSKDLAELVYLHGPVNALARLIHGEVTHALRAAAAPRLARVEPYRLAETARQRADRLGARIIIPEDDEWPHQLDDLARISRLGMGDSVHRDTYPPQCLWLRGSWRLDEACERSVSIVGARASTEYGLHVASELGYALADRGWTVISGGAFGVDAATHRGALAANGTTIAVLACGIDRPYPLSHTSLFDRIAEEGLLLSEWPPGTDPYRRRFLVRNRVIAALSQGTVLVEASARSGARFTIGRARLLGRRVLVVPGPITSFTSIGCHEELRQEGSRLVANAAHVIEEVGRIGDDLAPFARAAPLPADQLTPLQAQVLDGVRPRKPCSAEEIAAAAGVSGREARQILPTLEELGFVTRSAAGYRLPPPSARPTGAVPPAAVPGGVPN